MVVRKLRGLSQTRLTAIISLGTKPSAERGSTTRVLLCSEAGTPVARLVAAPWARGQTTFPTVRVNCAHEALRRRDVAACRPAAGLPLWRPRKGASRT